MSSAPTSVTTSRTPSGSCSRCTTTGARSSLPAHAKRWNATPRRCTSTASGRRSTGSSDGCRMRIEPEITGVLIELTSMERRLLSTLLTQYDEMVHDQLDDGDLRGDPALARLFPNAYPDDEEAAAEFRRYTRDGLVERKTANSGLISAALM